jgi:hypothetical protein
VLVSSTAAKHLIEEAELRRGSQEQGGQKNKQHG